MLTPFTKNNEIDYPALDGLIDWYIQKGSDGLFAVCLSSEMNNLSVEERVKLAAFVKEKAAGRVPVIASGHVASSLEAQLDELNQVAATGPDALIFITNHLANEDEDDSVLLKNALALMEGVPSDMPLGLYESPFPYKRLLTPEIMKELGQTGRFYFMKDTCCDIDQIKKRLAAIEGTNLKIYNANTATLLESLKSGAIGYSGVMANFHPELYAWLCKNYDSPQAQSLSDVLTMCALIEFKLYPVCAKYALNSIGVSMGIECRSKNHNEFTPTIAGEAESLMRLTKQVKELLNID